MAARKQDAGDTVTVLRAPRAAAVALAYRFEIISGPNAADKGRTLVVPPDQPTRVLFGTSPACEFRVSDPQVSRRHAALEPGEHGMRVTDLESTNGTRVNGVAVFDALLAGGEVVQAGDTMIRVDLVQLAASAPVTESTSFGRVVGSSLAMRRLYPLCERIAASSVPVVLEGETGTGKEMLAEALHEMGPRAAGPFVVFDCTAVPGNLLEAALFGHERGSFTGATETRKGVFEQAHGGSLLIDEIGDLDLSLQSKLLRAIERAEVRRVGGDRWIKVDVRVIAATRRDLDREVAEGRFRDDLFFRIAVTRLELPPLRKREGDIATLAHHFFRSLGGEGAIPTDFLARLAAHPWPGNVRELHNAVARQIALGDLARVDLLSGGPEVGESAGIGTGAGEDYLDAIVASGLPMPRARDQVLAEFERRYVLSMLALHGTVAKAAEASGIGRRYFQVIRARQK